MILHGSFGCIKPGASLGEGFTCMVFGDGDITNPGKRNRSIKYQKKLIGRGQRIIKFKRLKIQTHFV